MRIEHSTYSVNGNELSVATAGEGPPILLVPGILQSAQRWIDAGYVAALAPRYRVVCFDPLGHGRSEKSSEVADYETEQLVAHLLGALDHLSIEKAAVWGYSRGSAMAALLAHRHPERVRCLIHGGGMLFNRAEAMAKFGLVRDDEEMEVAHQRFAAGDWAAFWEHFPVPLLDDLKERLQATNDAAAIAAASKATRRNQIEWQRPEGVPTLAYWGRDEIFHSLNVDAARGEAIETAVIAGGHGQAFDPAAEALEVSLRFLDRHFD